MADLRGFDAEKVEPNVGFDPIPAGSYMAIITASEMKATKSNDGNYLELTFEIVAGEYKGRNLWDRLNIDNPNEKAVKIARGQLSAVCRAVGVMQPKDSIELHNLPLVVGVKLKKRTDTGEMTNEIKSYGNKGAVVAPEHQAQQATTQKAPWLRN